MGLDTAIKPMRKRKKVKSPEIETIIPRMVGDYECRTVNSVVDNSEGGHDLAPAVRKKRSKRKPEYIDSEVDLMRTPEPQPPPVLSLVKPKPQPVDIIEDVAETATSMHRNKRKKLNKTALVKALVYKEEPIKTRKTSPNKSPIRSPTRASPERGALSDPSDKYPVLKDQELVNRFLKVDFTNNQKGRIRQVLKDILRGTSSTLMPDVIHNKIQAILKSSVNLTDTDLRKIRVLYNMLKKATEELNAPPPPVVEPEVSVIDESKKDKESNKKIKKDKEKGDNESKDKPKKKKEPKRYVVFVGNLPLKVTREQILSHFTDIREYIKDVRIPQIAEDKKSSYAYVEFANAPVYEMALSKHHSMMGSKRINVLYTTQHNSKLSKTEAKAKSAKLVAMSKKGTLIGSVPLQRKRSARRAKARMFQKQAEKEMEDKNKILMKPRRD
ncbi:hypothetical protein O0L34_g18539 [Tuta absoluta]|nr:hypothetical protein O0L34_g18539 [Tuta absoluta]